MGYEPHTEDHPNRYRNPSLPPLTVQQIKHVVSFRKIGPMPRINCEDQLSEYSQHNDHLSACLIGLHNAMRFVDLLEAKHAGWLCLEPARLHLSRDFCQRHVGQREALCAEHKTAEEGEVDAAGHLQQRVEVLDRGEAAQPTCETRAAAATQHS